MEAIAWKEPNFKGCTKRMQELNESLKEAKKILNSVELVDIPEIQKEMEIIEGASQSAHGNTPASGTDSALHTRSNVPNNWRGVSFAVSTTSVPEEESDGTSSVISAIGVGRKQSSVPLLELPPRK